MCWNAPRPTAKGRLPSNMFPVHLLHILVSLIACVGLSLLPQFRVDGQSIDEYGNAMPFSVPLYYRDRPVIVERPIILTQPKLVVPGTNPAFHPPDDYLPDKAIYASYRPGALPFDRELEYSTSNQRKRKRRRRKRRRRRYG